MKKKILIGSIMAIAILIGISFTSAVGYKSVESNVNNSPLFNIRINRAKGEETKDISFNYITKEITLPFPKRNNKTILFQNIIYNISNMDDETFVKFTTSLINTVQKSNKNNEISSFKIKEALYQIKYSNQPISIINFNNNKTIKLNFGILKYILFLMLLPLIIVSGLFYWCFEPFGTVITPIPTSCCHPITLGKL